MEDLKHFYLDGNGNEISPEDYAKAREEATEAQHISQQATVQEFPHKLRAHRPVAKPKAVVTKPPVKEKVTEELKHPSWFKRNLKYIGAGMVAMTILWIVCTSYVYPAGVYIVTRWDYGKAKLTQFDLNVGHNGTSHFIAEYWHNQAVVIEFPQDHPERAQSYTVRMSSDGEDQPRIVTLHTAYINLHGKPQFPDLVVQVEGFQLPGVLYNTGDGFSTEQPS